MHKRTEESLTNYLERLVRVDQLEEILKHIQKIEYDSSATDPKHLTGALYGFNHLHNKLTEYLEEKLESLS